MALLILAWIFLSIEVARFAKNRTLSFAAFFILACVVSPLIALIIARKLDAIRRQERGES